MMKPSSIREIIKEMLPKSIVHAIQQKRLKRSISHYPDHVVTHRYGQHNFSVHLGDNLAQGWYDHDWDEPLEIGLLKQWSLKPGARVFDLGAHQGVVAMMLAMECRPGGRVISVEGALHNVLAARRNAVLNNLSDSIETLHAVVGAAHGGELCFSSTLNGRVMMKGAGERVRCVSIDGLAAEHGLPSLVFLDVEGYECQALKGAGQVLASGADFFIEVHVAAGLEENGSVEELLSFFPAERFELLMSPGEGKSFSPWSCGEMPEEKFFLAARCRVS